MDSVSMGPSSQRETRVHTEQDNGGRYRRISTLTASVIQCYSQVGVAEGENHARYDKTVSIGAMLLLNSKPTG